MPLSGGYYYPGVNTPMLGYKATKIVSSSLSTVPVSEATSGSIFWLTDRKYLVVYGPLGWTGILTGSAVAL